MNKDKKYVNRYFCTILYEEDPNFKKYFKNILDKYQEVTWITHNRDLNSNGENKKEHIHILWKVGENARSYRTVAGEIGIAENYIQGCNKDAYLRYLIHLDNPEKTQYSWEEVQGYHKERIKDFVENQTPSMTISQLLHAIKSNQVKNITDLIQYGIQNNCIKQIKSLQFLLYKAVEENKNLFLKGDKTNFFKK